jgi:suppressor for copper-sensitivity B
LGLKVQLKEGWKIYWRSPGDAGLPPELTLTSQNSSEEQKLEMDFPVPTRFSLFGLDTYGYSDEVIFPVRLRGHEAGSPLDLRANVNALVCADICIPVGGALRLTLPSGALRTGSDAIEIARFSSLVPKIIRGGAGQIASLSFAQNPDRLILDLAASAPRLIDAFVEAPINGLSFAAPQEIAPNRYKIAVSGTGDSAGLLGQPISLTLKTAVQFWQIDSPALAVAKSSGNIAVTSILFIFLAAFAGGLILNIMPCVLPVLSLKLASILSMGGASPAQIRLRLLAGAGGILTSFALLAFMLVGLKLAGGRLGWGIQYQNPWFLGVMIVVMAIFTFSLLDVVRLPVPTFASRIKGQGLLGDFASGFMATILATPCSAPLVGTAISFALAASAPQLFLVMLVMGIGLAAPWLALAVFPAFIASLPKPGAWMKWVKPILASGLVATLLWLGWLFAGAVGIPLGFTGSNSTQTASLASNQEDRWQVWQPQLIKDSLEAGQPVFVDVTADWCITCKVNKALVLNTDKIMQNFDVHNVKLLQADWTLPDPDTVDYLASFGRFGIPFNILYYPDGRAPVIFDELLSSEKINGALDKLN